MDCERLKGIRNVSGEKKLTSLPFCLRSMCTSARYERHEANHVLF